MPQRRMYAALDAAHAVRRRAHMINAKCNFVLTHHQKRTFYKRRKKMAVLAGILCAGVSIVRIDSQRIRERC